MKKPAILLLLLSSFAFSQQKTEVYNFGQSGMELIAKTKKDVVIISTHNAKMTIREDIAQKVYSLYTENKLEHNKTYVIEGSDANVTGNCVIRKKNNLIAVDFYYQKVEWFNGLIEIYKKKRLDKKIPSC